MAQTIMTCRLASKVQFLSLSPICVTINTIADAKGYNKAMQQLHV